LVTLAALLGILLTLALGRWQLGRAAQKEALQADMQVRARSPVLQGHDLLTLADPLAAVHRPVRLSGQWLAGQTVFLDNRPMAGRVGFYVLTPFQLEGSQTVVLVQRGWVPRNFVDRSQVPQPLTPAGAVVIQGRIAPSPSALYELGAASTGLIRQNLSLEAFRKETGLPLWGGTIVQTDAAADGLLRDWPAPAAGVEKHHGYAFQWFGLSALITLLYVWFQIVRKFRSSSRA
jgi:surfeit locus 1 family protein